MVVIEEPDQLAAPALPWMQRRVGRGGGSASVILERVGRGKDDEAALDQPSRHLSASGFHEEIEVQGIDVMTAFHSSDR